MPSVVRSSTMLAALALALTATGVRAQDLFVFEIYHPETEHSGTWELETHLNYFAVGPVATEQHVHAAFEVSHVVTTGVELGVYALAARRPGFGPEFGGWRLRSLLVAPDRWHLPFRLGFNAELEHTRPPFADHDYALELVPIFGWAGARWDLAINPGVELEFASATIGTETEFEPKIGLGYKLSRSIGLNFEYFGAVGEVGELLPVVKQVHQFYPSVDLHVGDDVVWNLGAGVGVTSAGNRLTLKTRVEFPLGGEREK